jgi:F-type H+-transporting ATPase subunit b
MIFASTVFAIPALQGTRQLIMLLNSSAAPTPTASPAEVVSGLLTPDQLAGYAVTAALTIVNLFIAYIVLKHFVFKPIINLLNKRREAVLSELEDAANKTASAQALMADAAKRIEDSKNEASAIMSDARVQADKQGRTIVTAAHTEASTVVDRATEDAKRMHNAMLDQMRDEVADLAIAIATKVVGSIIDDTHQKDMSDRIMDETLKAEVKKIE